MFDRKEWMKQYRKDNKKIKKYNKQWRKDNPGYSEQWRENNPGYNKQYLIDNKERMREHVRQYQKNRRRTNLKYNLNDKVGHAIWKALKGNKNNRHWEILVGYSLKDLIKRLKKTMPEGYNWQDYLEGRLHIDHKIPKRNVGL
ncbi:hypothetical protein ES708_34283 [subsurface metagenome]